jgi:cytochrome P450
MRGCPFQNDLLDLGNFEQGTPRDAIAALRAEQRVAHQQSPSGDSYWLVLQKADIDQVLRDPASFSSRNGPLLEDIPEPLLSNLRQAMTFMDPPAHRAKRALVDHAFRPDVLEARRDMMQRKVTEIVDAIAGRGQCEFVSEVAMPLPVHVIFTLLGFPESDQKHLVDLVNSMTLANDPDYAGSREEGFAASAGLIEWAAAWAARRRGEAPRDDMTQQLLEAEIDGERLSDEAFGAVVQGVMVGGTETTRNTLSWLFHELIRHPEQMALLQAEPERIPAAVEEILRYRNTVVYTRRTATRDVELAGQTLREGDKVVCLLSSVARDPALFEDPDRFDITRDPLATRRNLRSFGSGPHVCLGQHQARLNLEMMTRELLARLTDFRLLAPPTHFRSNFMDGFKYMPVAISER